MRHINNSSEFRYEIDFSMFDPNAIKRAFTFDKQHDYTKKHDTAFQVCTESRYFRELAGWFEPPDLFFIRIDPITITIKGFENLRDLKNLVRRLHDHYKK